MLMLWYDSLKSEERPEDRGALLERPPDEALTND
jgi:hypothetical protein